METNKDLHIGVIDTGVKATTTLINLIKQGKDIEPVKVEEPIGLHPYWLPTEALIKIHSNN